MARFSPSEAAFSGFRLVRERPRAVLAWAGALAMLAVFSWVLIYMLAWAPFMEMQTLQAAGRPDPRAMLPLMGEMAPAWLSIVVLALFIYTALFGAVFRSFFDPERHPMGGLRFGADEWRLLGALVLLLLILIGAHVVFWLAAFLVIFLAGVVAHAGTAVTGLVRLLAALAVICALAFVEIRLSLAFVATFAEKRIGIGRAWRLTRGHVWSLLGAYLLTAVFALIVYLLIYAVFAALMAAALLIGHGALADLWRLMRFPLLHAPPLFLAVWLIAQLALLWVGAALMAVMIGPSVAAYRAFSSPAEPVQA